MCLPFVRKTGHFQVNAKHETRRNDDSFSVVLLVSHVDVAVAGDHVGSRASILEMVISSRLFVSLGEVLPLSEISIE